MDDSETERQGKHYAPYKKFIGSIVPNWIMRRNDISQGAKLCFGRLAQFAGKNDCAFPGHQVLANELGVSVPAVKGYLRELSVLGVIYSQRMGSGNFSLYFFIEREGVVEFRSDGQKTIRQTDGQNPNRHRPSDGQDSSRPDGQNSISPNREESHKRESEEAHNENKKENKASTLCIADGEDDEIPW